jgi:hypothetical protein
MAITNLAGEQISVDRPIHIKYIDVIKFRHLTAWKFDALGAPRWAIAEMLGVTRMTVHRMMSNVPEHLRPLLSDLTMGELYSTLLSSKTASFSALFHGGECYRKTDKNQKISKIPPTSKGAKSSTGSNLRFSSLPENKKVWDSGAPVPRMWAKGVLVDKVGLPAERHVDPVRPRGGTFEFVMRRLDGTAKSFTAEEMRRWVIVHLKYNGLSYRQIGYFVGRAHSSCRRLFCRMPDCERGLLCRLDLESVVHVDKKGNRKCLSKRIHAKTKNERTPARTKGRRGGAKPGWSRL